MATNKMRPDKDLNSTRHGESREDKDKKEKVTPTDLKGKKVDGDPAIESDKPVKQTSNGK
jgi:hypothetical protein